MTAFLVGGGVDSIRTPGLLDPFRRQAEEHAGRERPRVAFVLVDERGSGQRFLPEYVDALGGPAALDVLEVFLRPGAAVDPGVFHDADGVVVAGGPAPAYLAGLSDAAGVLRERVTSGLPYLGFSAGAMIAATDAIVGGHRLAGREVCPEDWSEGLDEVSVRPGLGLVAYAVEVHAAQAGTLGRAMALVGSGRVSAAVAIDEDTCVSVAMPEGLPALRGLVGSGRLWTVTPSSGGGVEVLSRAGS